MPENITRQSAIGSSSFESDNPEKNYLGSRAISIARRGVASR